MSIHKVDFFLLSFYIERLYEVNQGSRRCVADYTLCAAKIVFPVSSFKHSTICLKGWSNLFHIIQEHLPLIWFRELQNLLQFVFL